MSRVLIIVCCLLLSLSAAHAQCPSNWHQLEIAASYGLISSQQVSDNFTIADNSAGTKTRTGVSGNSFITVRYFMFNRLALGLACGIASENGQTNDRAVPTLVSSTYATSRTTIAMEFCYIYYFRHHIEVYTLAGIGPSFATTQTIYNLGVNSGKTLTTKESRAIGQYTPVGIRIGNRLGGFAELGVGYKGMFNFGISYKFGSPCWWKQ